MKSIELLIKNWNEGHFLTTEELKLISGVLTGVVNSCTVLGPYASSLVRWSIEIKHEVDSVIKSREEKY